MTRQRYPQGVWLGTVIMLFAAAFLSAAVIIHECVLPYLTGELSLITQR
ncbi:MAG: hypothetical protein HY980_03220 [Candidatus Magasanikbacteria bacterium]|nr:hypothetical protein [Candidatus Magasanikbacteria bacterium]